MDGSIHLIVVVNDLDLCRPKLRPHEADPVLIVDARALGLTLVTNNTAEFEGVKGLTLENGNVPRRRKR